MATNWTACFARVRAALMRRGRTVHDAEDLVQEAWLRLACVEGRELVAKPEAYLMRTAMNLSVDAHRAHLRHGSEVVLDEVILVDAAPGADAVLLARERMVRLSLGLERLNAKTRDIFVCHRVEGMTYREIAARHGLSTSTVEKHIAKATLQITSWMEGW